MKCSKCGGYAVITLHYSQTHLCRKHFMQMFERKFKRTVREFGMIKKGEKIAVGLSGGKDSTVLLHLLYKLSKKHPFELIALIVDEGTGEYRKKLIENAKRECNILGISFKIVSYADFVGFTLNDAVGKNKQVNPCSLCGVIRRRLLNKAAKEAGADKIAIGHNLDDAVQTVFMNLMRNEPLRLLRYNEPLVNSPEFVQRIRPLIRIPEKEIAVYALLNGINTGESECPYAQYSLRKEIKHKVNEIEEKYPGTKLKIFSSFLQMEKLMRQSVSDKDFVLSKCKKCGELTSSDVCMLCRMLDSISL
ncbi:TIGR00269 family protein [Candidatus Micrarchaeota archaeon]|nr:TIGR00269 family protein [Candidatus Micrarchaeota archaeon]